ncbi:hypothetical protein TSAR_003693 [Trichomalopsis sarcophagae]|uniref:Uncharacterized protein n=1 Tax=Trichomalopsis sarcophagae TaxID=543379 RepID=A0A232ELC5_9HYME|nr:hypothetical protein TSAR_003693 [Trichomalopsis sarcophagae]
MPNLAELTRPLELLLKKNQRFKWGPEQDQKIQEMM